MGLLPIPSPRFTQGASAREIYAKCRTPLPSCCMTGCRLFFWSNMASLILVLLLGLF